MQHVHYAVPHRQLSCAREQLLELYREATEEWGWLVRHVDELRAGLDGNLPCWHTEQQFQHVDPRIKIARCWWCNVPSAALRRCGKCHAAMWVFIRHQYNTVHCG